ncbi:MAG TPA: sigma-70 family RNA polymerase sigma factor [Sedimentisphaerales bacterium]|nr:sigma-70 family RNA polymerase sigma factor [Sedimentisphaerales bacterium]
MLKTSREIKLLRRCLRGDPQAFEVIVANYQDLVCGITFSGTTDVQQSEELAQQTFINAWKSLSRLNDLSKFRPWLCTIARNNIRNLVSKNQRDIIAKAKPMENVNNAPADESGPLESAIKKEHEALVSDAIQQVPEQYREPLVLYYRQQQSVKQVALSLDLSEDVVKQRLHRGRQMIKEKLRSIVEETLSATGPRKAFTTAVIASIAGIAVKGSAVAAASGIGTAISTSGSTTGISAAMSGVTAKIIAAAAVAVLGIGAVAAYKQITKPDRGPEFSPAGIVVREKRDEQRKDTEETAMQRDDAAVTLSAIYEPNGDSGIGQSFIPPNQPPAAAGTVRLAIHVREDQTNKPIAGAQLRVNRGCGCNCEPDYYSTDANGFYLIDFGENKPSYLSILATKAGHVPMMFAWRDEMIENLSEKFSFYLPKAAKVGGVIESEDSRPIPSTTVVVWMNADESREHPWVRIDDYTVVADANGRWECDMFPPEPYRFSVKLRHFDYADTRVFVNDRDHKFEDFFSLKSVLVMKEGAFLYGWVTDGQGRPIEGASVFTGEDRFDNDARKTKTDSQGLFEFPHFWPQLQRGNAVLTVQAKGYAPELKIVPVRREMEPVLIALGPPHAIRVRVVDVNGHPVSGAGVDVDSWRKYRSLSWKSETDKMGRFLWNEAPGDEVDIDIYKDDYMRVGNEVFVARDEEYEVTMLPQLVISGSVVDAETNEPVQDFTAIKGIQWEGGGVHWETDAFDAKDFSEGRYKVEIGHPYPGHLIRIDAQGYLPTKSRVFDSNEGTVSYDFRMKKGTGLGGGTVYDPNGRPAGGAEIYVLTPDTTVNFENGKTSNRPRDTEWAVADEEGSFSFKALWEDSLYKLFVIHDKGFAEVSKEQWLIDPNITLQPWGRIEGTLYSGLRVAANQSVHLYNQDTHNDPEKMNYNYGVNVTSDDQGHFIIERAIAGRGAVARRIFSDDGRRSSYVGTKHIEVAGGQTTKVDIGGGGRLVTGTLIKPEWAAGTTELSEVNARVQPAQTQKMNPYEILGDLQLPRPQRFEEMTVAEVLQWYEEWTKSDEGRALLEEIQERMKAQGLGDTNYNAIVESDGSFRILDVRPGEYTLAGALRKVDARGYADYKEPVAAEIRQTFTVADLTEENQDIPVELGIVEFLPVAKLELNEPVPDFDVRSLEGGRLSPADLRGKYVLLTFYMVMVAGQHSLNEEMENLRRIQDDFAGHERFEMVGLTQGGIPLIEDLIKKFLAEQRLTWRQGIIDGSNYELMQTFKIQSPLHSLLIDPNGVLLANGLKGEELYEAVAKALTE